MVLDVLEWLHQEKMAEPKNELADVSMFEDFEAQLPACGAY